MNTFVYEPIETIPDPNKLYYCSEFVLARNFSYLMKLVLLTKHNDQAFNILVDYIDKNKQEVHKKNSKNWTALMIACRNSNKYSTIETVTIVIVIYK